MQPVGTELGFLRNLLQRRNSVFLLQCLAQNLIHSLNIASSYSLTLSSLSNEVLFLSFLSSFLWGSCIDFSLVLLQTLEWGMTQTLVGQSSGVSTADKPAFCFVSRYCPLMASGQIFKLYSCFAAKMHQAFQQAVNKQR